MTLKPLPLANPHRAPAAPAHRWAIAGVEPALCDALADPIVHLVMRRDGVTAGELRNVLIDARARLGEGRTGDRLCRCLAA